MSAAISLYAYKRTKQVPLLKIFTVWANRVKWDNGAGPWGPRPGLVIVDIPITVIGKTFACHVRLCSGQLWVYMTLLI